MKLPHPLILLLAASPRRRRSPGCFPPASSIAATIRPPAGASSSRAPITPCRPRRSDRSPRPCGSARFRRAADVIAVVLFVGGAWVVVDRLGTLPALVGALVARFARRGLWAIPVVSLFFATMGALENMQEEIIPLVPVLLVLGARARRRRGRGRGDERGRGDDRQRVRPDQSVSGGHRDEAGAAAAGRRRRRCGSRCSSRRSRCGSRGRCGMPREIAPSPMRRGRRTAPRRPVRARHAADSASRSRRWRHTSTARCGSTGDSTSCQAGFSSPALVAGLVGGLGVGGDDGGLPRRRCRACCRRRC